MTKAETAKLIRTTLLGEPRKIPRFIWSRDHKAKGSTTGSWCHCRLDGCPGYRLGVRWPSGRLTWPCTRSLKTTKGGQEII
jgi:hypothetical protein